MTLRSKLFWIFDLDGTLTLPVHDFDYIRRELDVPEISDILSYLDSLPVAEADRRRSRLKEIETELALKAEPTPGVAETLARLNSSGAQLGILTRNDRDIALLTLETIGVGHYFPPEHVLGRNETVPKPDPAGIRHLLTEWGAAPSDAVMVGDYLFDLQAGRAAGTTTVHVARPGGARWHELTDHAVASFDELAARLL